MNRLTDGGDTSITVGIAADQISVPTGPDPKERARRVDPVDDTVQSDAAVRDRAGRSSPDSHGRCRHVPWPGTGTPRKAAGGEQVLEPEGAHGPLVGRNGEYLCGPAERGECSPDDNSDVSPEQLGLVRPVGYENDRQAQPGVEVGQFLDGHCAGHGIERCEGLVEEEDVGPEHDRSGDRCPLPLAP